jgi:hypothetical protein
VTHWGLKMTDKDQVDDVLEGFFSAARDTPPKPSSELSMKMLEDSETVRAARAQPGELRRPERRNVLSEFLWLIGGPPAILALSTAALAGIWIGISPPDYMADHLQSYLQGSEYNETDSFWAVYSLGGFTVSTAGG